MNRKRVLIADDHAIVRDGIVFKFKNHFGKIDIEEATNGVEAIEKIKTQEFDLLILDVKMPKTDPISTVKKVLQIQPNLSIIIHSMHPPEMLALRFMKLGVKGYVSKEDAVEELIRATEMVLTGRKYYGEKMNAILAKGKMNNEESVINSLSNRELEIMLLLIDGLSSKEIASRLFIHSSTIGTHRSRIFEKLNVKNMVELTQLGMIQNLI